MKKTIAIVFTAILILSLCSCNKSEPSQASSVSEASVPQTAAISDSGTPLPENPEAVQKLPSVETPEFNDTSDYSSTLVGRYLDVSRLTDKTKKNAVDIVNGKTVYIDINGSLAVANGVSMDFSAVAAKDGSKLYMSTSVLGNDSTILRNDEGIYILDSSGKTATLLQKDMSENINKTSPIYNNEGLKNAVSFITSLFGPNELSFVSNGVEEFRGSAMTYEEYKAGDALIKLYYAGNTLRYISVDKNGAVSEIVINALSSTPESSLFDIPGDYTIK